jgi:phosphomannomutase / phosphoglucomutase
MKIKEKIFREYDIRGVVNEDFDSDFAYALGRVYAGKVYASSQENPCVVVGRDGRLTGEDLMSALISGIIDEGVNVIDSGLGPTPQVYFTVFFKNLDGGIQVTGSHNPPDQNGFKMMIGKKTLSGGDIQELKQGILNFKGAQNNKPSKQKGTVQKFDARTVYIQDLIQRSREHVSLKRKIKVVVDAGNGVGGLIGPEVLRGLGCEVIELYTEPDGRFPNHHPDPTVLENIKELRTRVVQEKADLGIAWDGDGDRIGVVDEKGEPIFGDMLLVIYGRQLIKEVQNPVIIGDVKCSELMFADLQSRGANTIMWKTGHSLIKAKLQELNGHLAGEMSGHIFFKHRFYGFDDALHASARLIEILSNSSMAISEMLSDLPKVVSTPEIRRDCPEEVKFIIAEKAKEMFLEYDTNILDGVRVTFPHGWGLVRASNTQPALVLRFEADTEEHLREYQSLVESRIEEFHKSMT